MAKSAPHGVDVTSEEEMKEEEGGEEENGADEWRGMKMEWGEMKKGEMEMVLGRESWQVDEDPTGWVEVWRRTRRRVGRIVRRSRSSS